MDPEDLIDVDDLHACLEDERPQWSFWFKVLFFAWLWS